jgi:hypothetical protein
MMQKCIWEGALREEEGPVVRVARVRCGEEKPLLALRAPNPCGQDRAGRVR